MTKEAETHRQTVAFAALIAFLLCWSLRFAITAAEQLSADSSEGFITPIIHFLTNLIRITGCIDGLIARIVCQNTGKNAACTLCRRHTAKNQREFAKQIEDIIIKQNEITVGNDRDE